MGRGSQFDVWTNVGQFGGRRFVNEEAIRHVEETARQLAEQSMFVIAVPYRWPEAYLYSQALQSFVALYQNDTEQRGGQSDEKALFEQLGQAHRMLQHEEKPDKERIKQVCEASLERKKKQSANLDEIIIRMDRERYPSPFEQQFQQHFGVWRQQHEESVEALKEYIDKCIDEDEHPGKTAVSMTDGRLVKQPMLRFIPATKRSIDANVFDLIRLINVFPDEETSVALEAYQRHVHLTEQDVRLFDASILDTSSAARLATRYLSRKGNSSEIQFLDRLQTLNAKLKTHRSWSEQLQTLVGEKAAVVDEATFPESEEKQEVE
ncbi:hypothetical protein [Aureibacillus halotolerans]|nr:hypothetical protein [Aureibacillus halotolerans]